MEGSLLVCRPQPRLAADEAPVEPQVKSMEDRPCQVRTPLFHTAETGIEREGHIVVDFDLGSVSVGRVSESGVRNFGRE